MSKKTNLDFNNRNIANALKIILLLFGIIFGVTANAQAAGVSLTATPASNTVTVGQTASCTIKINRDGYTDKVTLSATGLPAGVTATFTPNSTTANSSTLKLQTAGNTPIGIFNITVKGTANAITIAPITIKLTTKAQAAISISVLPAAQLIVAGKSIFFDISIRRTNYDGAVMLSATDVPSGVTVYFEPPATNGNSSRMYLYSNGLPFAENTFWMNVVAAASGTGINADKKPMELRVNCGIVWAQQFNAINEQDLVTDYATAVHYDAAGNVYVAGHRDDVNNYSETWIAKFDANGNRLWISPIRDGYWEYVDKPTDIIVDSANNVYVAGVRDDEGDIHSNNSIAFIAKFDANGNLLRLHSDLSVVFRGDNGSRGIALHLNGSGNVVLTAVMDVVITEIFNSQQTMRLLRGSFDLERLTFDAVFNFSRTTLLNDAVGLPNDIAVDRDGAVYIVGTNIHYDSPFRYDSFVQKFVPDGGSGDWFVPDISPLNRRTEGIDSFPQKVVVSANRDVFVNGATNGAPSEYWQVKVRADGGIGWLKTDVTINAKTKALTVDANGDVYYGGATDFSLGALNADRLDDVWFAKRSGSDGSLLYVKQFHSESADSLNDVKVDGAGNLFLAGQTRGLVQNTGSDDSFLIKFSPANFPLFAPRITSVNPTTVNPGGLFRINGFNLGNTQAVFHNDKFLPFLINSSTEIFATAPDGLNGTGNITILCGCLVTGFSLN